MNKTFKSLLIIRIKDLTCFEEDLPHLQVAAIPYMYTDNILCISNKIKGVVTPFVGPYFDFIHAYLVE